MAGPFLVAGGTPEFGGARGMALMLGLTGAAPRSLLRQSGPVECLGGVRQAMALGFEPSDLGPVARGMRGLNAQAGGMGLLGGLRVSVRRYGQLPAPLVDFGRFAPGADAGPMLQ